MLHPHDIFSPNEPWTIRIVSLAREFRDAGHRVKLAYCPLDIDEEKIHIDLSGIELTVLSRKTGLKSLLRNIKTIKELSRGADLIHFQKCFHYVAIPALVCAWLMDKPLHYDWDDWEEKIWYHSNKPSLHTLIFGNFIKLLERWLPLLADTVSVSSHKLRDLCICFGAEEERVFKAAVGADTRQFAPHVSGEGIKARHNLGARRVIVYLGQLHAGQYVKMFIEAANIVLHKYPNAVFLIIGQGHQLDSLRGLVEKLGVENSVIFTGSVPHDRVPEYIAAADICAASFEHNEVTICKSPLKIVEYMAIDRKSVV